MEGMAFRVLVLPIDQDGQGGPTGRLPPLEGDWRVERQTPERMALDVDTALADDTEVKKVLIGAILRLRKVRKVLRLTKEQAARLATNKEPTCGHQNWK